MSGGAGRTNTAVGWCSESYWKQELHVFSYSESVGQKHVNVYNLQNISHGVPNQSYPSNPCNNKKHRFSYGRFVSELFLSDSSRG